MSPRLLARSALPHALRVLQLLVWVVMIAVIGWAVVDVVSGLLALWTTDRSDLGLLLTRRLVFRWFLLGWGACLLWLEARSWRWLG